MEESVMKFSPLGGDWEIKEEIGKGSYGKVYRAEKKSLGITYECAVKHIKVPPDDVNIQELISNGSIVDAKSVRPYLSNLLNDFIKEIKICDSLKGNTNIVSYEDHYIITRDDDKGYDVFIRMELLKNLNSSKSSWNEEEIVRLGIDMCTALEILAENHIIHRDIKPSNIFVAKGGIYKLGDFGEAKVLSQMNREMSIRGSYPYMSPEIYFGKADSDIRADIYSLGMVMYRLLNNNRPPFVDPYATSISGSELSESDIKRFRGENIDIPPCNCHIIQLSKAILKACKSNPNERWQNPTEFKNCLLEIENILKSDRTFRATDLKNSNSNNKSSNAKPITGIGEYNFEENGKSADNNPPLQNKTNKIMVGIIIILILVLVLVTGMFLGNILKNDPDKNENNSETTSKESESSVITAEIENSVYSTEESILIDESYPVNIPVQSSDESSKEEPKVEKVKVVSYVNQPYKDAEYDLSQKGLYISASYEYNSDIDAGNVISQSVNAGNEVEKNTSIALTVSKGPNFSTYVPSNCHQVVHFVSSGSNAVMKFYELEDYGWVKKFTCPATVGQNGVGTNYGEGKKISPKGTFPLGVVISANRMSYNMGWQPCTSSTVIVEDVNSPYYNQIKDKSELSSNTDYDAIGNRLVTGVNNACIFIEHNGNGYSQNNVVRGRCSSITICGCYNSIVPTWGCVDISANDMETLLSWLNSSYSPYIKID